MKYLVAVSTDDLRSSTLLCDGESTASSVGASVTLSGVGVVAREAFFCWPIMAEGAVGTPDAGAELRRRRQTKRTPLKRESWNLCIAAVQDASVR